MRRLRSFWGFKILNFNIYFFYLFIYFFFFWGGGGGQKNGDMKILWIFCGGGGHHKIGLYLGVISMHLSVIS